MSHLNNNAARITRQAEAGDYASVNDLEMYYEIHATGKPLVLLHVVLSTVGTSFGKVLPTFAKPRQVFAVEQQARGHTADIHRQLSYGQTADDTAALLRHLMRHPLLVHRLVVA